MEEANEPERTLLPLFPLGTVLFPGLVLPLQVFEPRYRTLVQHLAELPAGLPREFGVIAIRRGWRSAVSPAAPDDSADASITAGEALSLYEIGCAAEIRQITELSDGRFDLMTVGGADSGCWAWPATTPRISPARSSGCPSPRANRTARRSWPPVCSPRSSST